LADEPWSAGYVVDGKYRLTTKLGQGGMGAVWRADHLTLNAPVAVKLLDPSISHTEEGLARFLREAQAAAALRGTHVVQTFDYGIDKDVPFIVMELLVGENLAQRVSSKGPMPAPAVAMLLKQVARAMSKAHQAGIVHRDLKPDNIFLVDVEDDEPLAKVLDFGIAKASGELAVSLASKTRTGALLGTPFYMSPEQAQGTMEVDFRSDLWALGVITFEALVGKRPFESEALGDLLLKICVLPIPVPSKHGAVPAGFDAWFARAVAREPSQRFGSASEMARAFERIVHPGRAMQASVDLSMSSPGLVMAPAGDSLEGTEVLAAPTPSPRRPFFVMGAAVAVVLGGIALLAAFQGHATAASSGDVVRKTAALAPAPTTETRPALQAPSPAAPAPAPSADVAEEATAPAEAAEPAALHAAKTNPQRHGIAVRPVSASRPKASGKKTSSSSSYDPLEMRR
jgi:serine/threonine-protein kinase